jgi:hypothetical protein
MVHRIHSLRCPSLIPPISREVERVFPTGSHEKDHCYAGKTCSLPTTPIQKLNKLIQAVEHSPREANMSVYLPVLYLCTVQWYRIESRTKPTLLQIAPKTGGYPSSATSPKKKKEKKKGEKTQPGTSKAIIGHLFSDAMMVNELNETLRSFTGRNIDLMLTHPDGTTVPSPSSLLLFVYYLYTIC